MGNIKVAEMEITPEMAEEWLNRDQSFQRKVRRDKIKQYAADMRSGNWVVNAETIILSDDNPPVPLNGQHRLKACVEAGVSFRSLVAVGVPRSVFHTIDTGASRSPNDIVGVDRKSRGLEIRNIAHVNAAISLCIDWAIRGFKKVRPLPRIQIEFLDRYPDIEEWVALALKGGTRAEKRYAAHLGAIGFMVGETHPIEAKRFIHQFITGENLSKGHSVLALRHYLLDVGGKETKRTRAGFSRKNVFAVIARAWNEFLNGKEVMHFRIQAEMPELEGARPIEIKMPDE